jgi:hypothetical protein
VIPASAGDRYVGDVILVSIVVPIVLVGALAWYFWRHRHDD